MKMEKYRVLSLSLKAVALAALLTFALYTGSYLGLGTHTSTINNAGVTSNINAREEKIAVVNLDDGVVDSVGNRVSYSEDILPESSKLYSIMSYGDAEKSLNNGNVDAVITIPPEFSEKVLGVNQNKPEKILLDYEISGALPEKRNIEINRDVIDFQMYMSSKLSYTYIYSIYTELHAAQDQTTGLLKNDDEDMKATEILSMYEFLRELNLSDMPEIDPNLKDSKSEIDTAIKSVEAYAAEMVKLYEASYKSAKDDYIQKASILDADLVKANQDIEDFSTEAGIYEAAARAWINSANTWSNDIIAWHGPSGAYTNWKNSADNFMTAANSWNANYAAPWISSAETWNDDATEYYDKLADYQTLLNQWYTDMKNYYDNNSGLLPSAPSDLLTVLGGSSGLNVAIPSGGNQPNVPAAPSVPSSLPMVPSTPTITSWPASVPSSLSTLPVLQGQLPLSFAWDPNNFITQTERNSVAGIVSSYSDTLSFAQSVLNNRDGENISMFNNIFITYGEYVTDMRYSIEGAYDKEHTDVENAREALVAGLRGTSEENVQLIGAFSAKLPASRSFGGVNKELADFVTSPVELNMHGNLDGSTGGARQFISLATIISSAVFLSSLIALLLIQAQKRKKQS